MTEGYIYKPKDHISKIHQGKIKNILLVDLLKESNQRGMMAYLYRRNKTYEMMIESWCPKKFKCVYNPWQKEPNIDDVINL